MRGLLGSYTPRTRLSPSRGGEEEKPELRRRGDGGRMKPPDDVHKARALGAEAGVEERLECPDLMGVKMWTEEEEKPKLRRSGDGMGRTALSLGARGERGSRSDAEARRDEANELKEAPAAL